MISKNVIDKYLISIEGTFSVDIHVSLKDNVVDFKMKTELAHYKEFQVHIRI